MGALSERRRASTTSPTYITWLPMSMALDDAAIEKRDGTFLENEAAFGARWVRFGNGSVVARDEFLDVVPAFHAEMLKILKRRGFVEHRDARTDLKRRSSLACTSP